MNKSIKIALISLLTVACGVGGYFVAEKINIENKTTHKTGKIGTGGGNSGVANMPREGGNDKISDKGDIAPTITSVSEPVYNASTKKYTFNVVADEQDLTYVLASYNGTVLKTQDSGSFTVDPVQNTGKYLVYVTNSYGTQSEVETVSGCVFVYEKLTAAQIQAAFNSGDYLEGDKLDFKNRIARSCTYTYTNLMEGDEKPSSFSEIFNRIQLSSWKAVTVNSVSYDPASNQATRINMTINY